MLNGEKFSLKQKRKETNVVLHNFDKTKAKKEKQT